MSDRAHRFGFITNRALGLRPRALLVINPHLSALSYTYWIYHLNLPRGTQFLLPLRRNEILSHSAFSAYSHVPIYDWVGRSNFRWMSWPRTLQKWLMVYVGLEPTNCGLRVPSTNHFAIAIAAHWGIMIYKRTLRHTVECDTGGREPTPSHPYLLFHHQK